MTPSPGASTGGVYPAKASGAGSTETAMNFSEERELQQVSVGVVKGGEEKEENSGFGFEKQKRIPSVWGTMH